MFKKFSPKDILLYRDLPPFYEEMYVISDDKTFEELKELIDDCGLLYNGEKKYDDRQVLEYQKRKKLSSNVDVKAVLAKKSRQEMRKEFLKELRLKKVRMMSPNVKFVCELLYRTGYLELGI